MYIDKVEDNAYSLYDLYSHALALDPDSNEINHLCIPFLSHHCFIINLYDPSPCVDKKRRINISCSLQDLAQAQNPCSRGNSMYNFDRFLGQHYYTLNLSDLCLSEEKKIPKGIMHFHYLTYLVTP